jgi:hypothetical protein
LCAQELCTCRPHQLLQPWRPPPRGASPDLRRHMDYPMALQLVF